MVKLALVFLAATHFSDNVEVTTQTKPVQLASQYEAEVVVKDYLMSEKYDGVRAIWDGQSFRTRSGRIIHAPAWFIEQLPPFWVDGELWIDYGQFEQVSGLIRKQTPLESEWRRVNYYIFDAPQKSKPFEARYQDYLLFFKHNKNSPNIKPVIQYHIRDKFALDAFFQAIIAKGGEGVIIHHKKARHIEGRSDLLLKYKPLQIDIAIVVGYSKGKGKYINKVGALILRSETYGEFKLGSGLSDELRSSPPKLGSKVKFQFEGVTRLGKPRFARFLEAVD